MSVLAFIIIHTLLWIMDLSKGKWTRDLERGMSKVYIGQVRSGQSTKKSQNIS
jgi:hypothetical protein